MTESNWREFITWLKGDPDDGCVGQSIAFCCGFYVIFAIIATCVVLAIGLRNWGEIMPIAVIVGICGSFIGCIFGSWRGCHAHGCDMC
jgi:hypothetical protein